VGVNSDRRESNLEVIPDDELSLWRGSGGTGSGQASGPGEGPEPAKPRSLWWYAMLLVLAAALLESLLAARYLATQREES
jgi:hypothetical protein